MSDVYMKKFFLILLMNGLLFSSFAKTIGIKILTNPLFPLYDIGYSFADNTAETFQVIGDLEIQIPMYGHFNLSIYQKLSFDSFLESYCVNQYGFSNLKKALQTEYFIEPGITYNFKVSGEARSSPFMNLFPVVGFVDIHTDENRADFLLLGAGLTGGYQWNFSSGFVLKLYAGLSKVGAIGLSESAYNRVESFSLFGLPFDLRFGCMIGLGF